MFTLRELKFNNQAGPLRVCVHVLQWVYACAYVSGWEHAWYRILCKKHMYTVCDFGSIMFLTQHTHAHTQNGLHVERKKERERESPKTGWCREERIGNQKFWRGLTNTCLARRRTCGMAPVFFRPWKQWYTTWTTVNIDIVLVPWLNVQMLCVVVCWKKQRVRLVGFHMFPSSHLFAWGCTHGNCSCFCWNTRKRQLGYF